MVLPSSVVMPSARVSLFGWWSEHAHNDCVISFVWLQCDLFLRFQFVRLQFLDFGRKHCFWLGGRVNARRLNRNDKVAAILEEMLGVQGHDTCLIGLRDIGEHCIDNADQHAVLVWVARVLDDRNNVGAFLGNVYQVASGSV